jgi:hypothetical protein
MMRNTQRSISLVIVLMGLLAPGLYSAPASQRSFETPQAAIQATVEASKVNDVAGLRDIFGAGSQNIVESGDSGQDREDRQEFAKLAEQKISIAQDASNPDRVTFSIGNDDWPFPVPLVRTNGKWRFDTSSGRMEIIAHRIGENEIDAIDNCRAFVDAELEYASKPRDGAHIQEYARKLVSSAGHHDGLYWDGAPGGLLPEPFAEAVASGKPYHGYRFRILTAQGRSAPGGALNYLVNGQLMGGVALVAWPAQYEVSGVKTFIVSHNGVVYEKDLGLKTDETAKTMSRFDPDSSWREVHED